MFRQKHLMLAFNKAVIERAMGAEMNMHLGYRPRQPKPVDQANERNGASGKTLITDHGALRVRLPRDLEGSFEPIQIPGHARHFPGFGALRVKIRSDGMISSKAVYLPLAGLHHSFIKTSFRSAISEPISSRSIFDFCTLGNISFSSSST